MQIWKGDEVPILAWVDGVPIESEAITQMKLMAKLPFIYKHIAAMPDMHVGIGATVGTVVPTKGAVIPSAVGVDIGCGMCAVRTDIDEDRIPIEKRSILRSEIERLVPTGRTNQGGRGDKGAWDSNNIPKRVKNTWREHLEDGWKDILRKNSGIQSKHGVNHVIHLRTLGGGNHFIEICVDLDHKIWIMLHSGSRGVGSRIGQFFIRAAKSACRDGCKSERKAIDKEINGYLKSDRFRSLDKKDRKRKAKELKRVAKERKDKLGVSLPHRDLAYLEEGTKIFDEYMQAALWAQEFARLSRKLMLEQVTTAVKNILGKFETATEVNCHHNYVALEEHFGEKVFVTRKGAIRAGKDELGIIPGSMGAKSYIVSGKGNPDSFCSASHGAGRKMSRSAAKRQFTVEDHRAATDGIECAKDEGVLDETPLAYKDIDSVMNAESDLVEVRHTLKQIICVKGE